MTEEGAGVEQAPAAALVQQPPAGAETDADRALKYAQREKVEAETRKLKLEMLNLEAQTREALAGAEIAEIRMRAEMRDEEFELAQDMRHYEYTFAAGVDDQQVERCIRQLKFWERSTPEPGKVTLTICSPGGSVVAGMRLFDHITAMRGRGWYFTTVVRGYAASMGGILLQAGDERVIGPESYILIHEVSTIALGKIGEIEDEVEWMKMIQERVLDIFASRSGGKVTKAALRRKWSRKDWWLDSDEALRLGIVDRVG